ncbi:MAG TPA: 5'/3'-nucleotidase SurE, partial [Candidatus Caenarcaniphilales bacterium]
DCIKLGLGALMDTPPELVLAGINQGPNLGTDVLYSGTVSAAMEGVIEGISSLAFSLASFSSQEFAPAATFAQMLLAQLNQSPLPEAMLLNINVPALTMGQVAGIAVTRLGMRRYYDLFQKRVDPRGKTYYWLAGEVLEELEEPAPGLPRVLPTDVQLIRKNYITVTPLKYNLTYAGGIEALSTWINTQPPSDSQSSPGWVELEELMAESDGFKPVDSGH